MLAVDEEPPHLHKQAHRPGQGPVGVQWITTSMGMTAQEAREDRILHELHATGGDLRRICDMFGLSITGASRHSAVLAHTGLQNA
ncbi:hypothetical protein [Arthrobacter sp. Soil736]|uniref:hypothetical protein n=1 Tax=Arthrobacter sp. Soil736 TaxID=1736395 RepID=UPI000AB84023|nr:hypothetical protein [Arthrobacter sp. Soil736]